MMREVLLKDICELKSGSTPRRNKKEYWEKGTIPWAKISDLETSSDGYIYDTEEYITKKALESINNRFFKKGTLLLAMYGSVGKTAIANIDLTMNQAILGINIKDEDRVNLKYLRYWLNVQKDKLLKRAVGATLKNLSKTIIEDLKIPLPSLATQKAIAARLDLAEKVKNLNQQLLEKYDELAQAVFLEMFGDPRTNPKKWNLKLLGKEFDISSGGTPSTKIKSYWENGNISWIGSNMCQNKILFENDGKFITKKGLQKSAAKLFPVNTVLIALVGATIGKVGLNRFETTTNQNIAGIRPNENYDSLFVMYYLMNSYHKFLELGDKGFRMANLSFIRKLEIFHIPISLQTEFARRIENIEKQKELLRREIQKSEELFESLLQESFSFPSFSKKKRGRFDAVESGVFGKA